MKAINYIRILDDGVILIPIHYALDTEHGLEIKLRHNKVEKQEALEKPETNQIELF